MKINGYMVFDVESVGLHGEAFAAGWVTMGLDGKINSEGISGVSPHKCSGSMDGLQWVMANCVDLDSYCTQNGSDLVRMEFWSNWMHAKKLGYVLAADCAWPVEARFLIECVRDDFRMREWEGPYPLIDIASIILAHGDDPLQTFERVPNELPAHNPLNDARQSARILAKYLKLGGSMTRNEFAHLARTITIQDFQDGKRICVNSCTKEQLFDVFWIAAKQFGFETLEKEIPLDRPAETRE